ncbi:MAG: NAD+ synthase [Phycisphaerales bacterium]|nr:MAG: NAD+ synthase [Phycisphaerales bacterium]
MKVALAQTNPIVGDIEGNSEKIARFVVEARDAGADLVAFPELAVLGYPPRDLLLKDYLVRDNQAAIQRVAEHTHGITAVVGYVQPSDTAEGKSLRNAVALCRDGRVIASYGKQLLPTYDVFDELRYFEPDRRVAVSKLPARGREMTAGFSICEDLWNEEQLEGRRLYPSDPIVALVEAGAELLINVSASPFYVEKQDLRVRLFGRQVARHRVPLVYVNQVGGNDDLVFDGASAAFGPDGSLIAQARAFDEDLLIVDLDTPARGQIRPYPDTLASVHQALVTGTRDYVNKCGFQAVVIGLSGGIDSAVTAAIAVAALGSDRVHTVAMPSRYSSDHSLTDAARLARNLDVDYRVIPIDRMHRAVEAELAPHFAGRPPDVTEENIQARIRGNVLMSLSNKFGWLLLTTGNKSELAVGYCTLYGDMCGGLAVISDVPKTMVYDLARYINRDAAREVVPESTITKPPSAELKEDQTDQDSLPPYDVLDEILRLYIEHEQSVQAIAARGFDPALVKEVVRKVDVNEYKRKQAAVGLKVTSRAFGTGRRMPIAARYR